MPVTLIAGEAAPTSSTAGATVEIVGAGFVTCKLIVVPEPLLADPLRAITDNCAPVVSCEAGTATVT